MMDNNHLWKLWDQLLFWMFLEVQMVLVVLQVLWMFSQALVLVRLELPMGLM